jgi:hypothetical protein
LKTINKLAANRQQWHCLVEAAYVIKQQQQWGERTIDFVIKNKFKYKIVVYKMKKILNL